MKRILVCGGNGFIGHHLARRLKREGNHVTALDIKRYEYGDSNFADKEIIGDLTSENICKIVFKGGYDEVYQLAALMGGCQYIFTGGNDADIMQNNARINLNVCNALKGTKTKVFFSSSACAYPQGIQSTTESITLKEDMLFPLDPDSMYGLEKAFSEQLYQSYKKNYDLNIRIGRFHNIYGTATVYKGGKEKAPASITRKVIEANGKVQIWGTGEQRRSFLYIDDCIDAVLLLMKSDFKEPINIGSEESVTINELWKTAINVSGKELEIEHIERPENTLGVMSRNSDNTLIRKELGWEPKHSLQQGITKLHDWLKHEMNGSK